MITGRHRYLLLLESECYLESKESDDKDSWNEDFLKLFLETAIAKFLIKGDVIEKVFYNASALHLCSVLVAGFPRFYTRKRSQNELSSKLIGINVFVFNV